MQEEDTVLILLLLVAALVAMYFYLKWKAASNPVNQVIGAFGAVTSLIGKIL